MNMRKIILLMACAAAATLAAHAQLPNVRVENAHGETVSTQTLAAKKVPLILSFWSTTCAPCIVELDAMNRLMDQWRAEAQFEVVAVSTDDARATAYAKTFARGKAWNSFTMLYDKNQELKRALNVNLIPHTFIFDADGKMVYSHTGYTPGTEAEYIEIIKSLK